MKKYFIFICLSLVGLAACHSGDKSSSAYPEGFDKIGDIGRINYMKQRISPDSLARFVIDGALGRNPGAPIDSLANATLYIYDHLQGKDLDDFSMSFDSYVESLPLDDKMRTYLMASSEDPQKLGYRLGLEYVGSIRDEDKSVEQVEKELKAFRKACGTDTATYSRFLIGFHTVMVLDSGKNLKPEIYSRFLDYK